MADRTILEVEYDDGQTAEINPNRPALLIAFETEHGVPRPETNRQVAWIAWHGMGRPDGDLDAWLERVANIQVYQAAAGKAGS